MRTMSVSIPDIEPSAVIAGDTIQWSKSLPDYPASAGWVLTYALLSSSGKISITASADGDDHLVNVAAATSANYTAGTYQWQAYVTHATYGRFLAGSGSIVIKANYAAITAATDTRSHVKKVLDAIEAVIEGTATTDQQEITIDGTKIVRRTVADLLTLRSRYLCWYNQELQAQRAAAGLDLDRGKWRVKL